MITSIRLVNFKNFADETLRLGPVTILVGANASGKSNVRDAFRILHGIGRGYTLAEIFGGKREAGWLPIRGAMNEIIRFGQSAFSIEVEMKLSNEQVRYFIEIGTDEERFSEFRVTEERLRIGKERVYVAQSAPAQEDKSLSVSVGEPEGERSFAVRVRADRPVLRQIISELLKRSVETLTQAVESFQEQARRSPKPGHGKPGPTEFALNSTRGLHANHMLNVVEALSLIRFWDLSPDRMREPAAPGATVLGDGGENLSTALQEICTDPKRRETLTSWLHELTPMDVTGFEFPRDPSGRVHLVICEKNGRKVSASSASDGTLRFLAMLAALFGGQDAGPFFFDELDTGIHPARQWLLLELIEKRAAERGIQVLATTHAPDLLTFVNDGTFAHLSVIGRLEDADDAIIRPVADLPNAEKLRTSQGGLGRLLTEGWMEDMLTFTQDDDKTEADGE